MFFSSIFFARANIRGICAAPAHKAHCFLSRRGFSCTLMVIKVATRCGKEPNRHLGCTLLQNQFYFREVFRLINEKGGSRCRISRMDDSRRCKTEENKEKQGKKTDIRHARWCSGIQTTLHLDLQTKKTDKIINDAQWCSISNTY